MVLHSIGVQRIFYLKLDGDRDDTLKRKPVFFELAEYKDRTGDHEFFRAFKSLFIKGTGHTRHADGDTSWARQSGCFVLLKREWRGFVFDPDRDPIHPEVVVCDQIDFAVLGSCKFSVQFKNCAGQLYLCDPGYADDPCRNILPRIRISLCAGENYTCLCMMNLVAADGVGKLLPKHGRH